MTTENEASGGSPKQPIDWRKVADDLFHRIGEHQAAFRTAQEHLPLPVGMPHELRDYCGMCPEDEWMDVTAEPATAVYNLQTRGDIDLIWRKKAGGSVVWLARPRS